VTNNGDGTFTINLADLPIGRHAVRIIATDGCGNTAVDLIIFEIADNKAPTPICINGLTVTLMPDGEGGGMGCVWVSDFIASPSFDCSGEVKFAIYRAEDAAIPGFEPNPIDTGLCLDCNDDATTIVRIYAIDPEGQSDYCETTLLVQHFQDGICEGGGVGSLAGTISTETANVVPGVTVTLSGDMSGSTTTDADGRYVFSDLQLGEDYTLTPSFNSYEHHLSGVSTFDLVLISRYILGIADLSSPAQLLAADANADENISVQDIIAIRRFILGLDLAYAHSPAWLFVDQNFVFPNLNNPWATTFPQVYNVNNLAGAITNANILAIPVGDVNGSIVANGFQGEAQGRSGSLGLSTNEVEMVAGNTYTVEFTASQAAQLAGFQGTLKLAEGAEFVGLEYGAAQAGNFNTSFADRGLVTMSYNVSGTELATDELIFSLVINATVDARLSEVVSINSEYTAAEAYTINNQIRNLNIDFGGNATEAASFELLQNTPNPVADVTTIGFNLPVAGEVLVSVQDVNGKVVLNRSLEGFAGYNNTVITADELGANGIFTYTITSGDFTATKKMVVVR